MAGLRAWLLSVTAAAFAVALAQALTPAGTVKKVGRLVGGLVLLLAVAEPVLRLDPDDLAVRAAFYEPGAGEEVQQAALAAYIEDSTCAYIAGRAEELGIRCTVEVETETGEAGWPVPVSAEVAGMLTAAQRQALSVLLTTELGIPAQRQTFWEGGS